MANTLKEALRNMRDRAKAISGINSVSVWNNDLMPLRSGADDTIVCPHISIEFNFENPPIILLHGVTQRDIVFSMHVLYRNDNDPFDLDSTEPMPLDYRNDVLKAFTLFAPTNCTPLQYAGEEADFDHDNVYRYTVRFRTSYTETKGSPFDVDSDEWITKTPEELPLTLEIEAEKLPEE